MLYILIVLLELWQYKFWDQINDELLSLKEDSITLSSRDKHNHKNTKNINRVHESVQRLRSEFAATKHRKSQKRLKEKEQQKTQKQETNYKTNKNASTTINMNSQNNLCVASISSRNGSKQDTETEPKVHTSTSTSTSEASQASTEDCFCEKITDYATNNYVNASDIDADTEQSESHLSSTTMTSNQTSDTTTSTICSNSAMAARFDVTRKRHTGIILKLLRSMPWFSMPLGDGMYQFANDSFKYRYAIYLFNKYISSNGYDALNISWITSNEIELNIAKIYQFVMKYNGLKANKNKIEIENVSLPKFSGNKLSDEIVVKDIETIDELKKRLDHAFDCAVCYLFCVFVVITVGLVYFICVCLV